MLIACHHSNRRRPACSAMYRLAFLAGLMIHALIIPSNSVRAAKSNDTSSAERQPGSAKTAIPEPGEAKTTEETEAETRLRKQKVQAAFYLLGGIAFVGLLTILGVVLWGIRVRRRAREPAKSSSPPDPLWYLRKGKKGPDPADSHSGDPVSETNADRDDLAGS